MDSPDITIVHEEEEQRGRFAAMRAGQVVGEMTYSRGSPRLVIINHTEVDPSLRGQGMGRQLLDALVAWARASDTKVMSTCPFSTTELESDPTLSDVRL